MDLNKRYAITETAIEAYRNITKAIAGVEEHFPSVRKTIDTVRGSSDASEQDILSSLILVIFEEIPGVVDKINTEVCNFEFSEEYLGEHHNIPSRYIEMLVQNDYLEEIEEDDDLEPFFRDLIFNAEEESGKQLSTIDALLTTIKDYKEMGTNNDAIMGQVNSQYGIPDKLRWDIGFILTNYELIQTLNSELIPSLKDINNK